MGNVPFVAFFNQNKKHTEQQQITGNVPVRLRLHASVESIKAGFACKIKKKQ